MLRPRKLHMSKTRNHRSSNSSRGSSIGNNQRTCVATVANEATGHPSLSQLTPPAGANPANQDQTDTAHQAAEDNCWACRKDHWSHRKSSKPDVLLASSDDAELRTTRRDSAQNIHREVTHLHIWTRHYLQTGMEDTKSNDRRLSIVNSHNTHRPLSASGLTG